MFTLQVRIYIIIDTSQNLEGFQSRSTSFEIKIIEKEVPSN